MDKEKVLGVVRHVLTFVGGVLVANGFFDDQIAQEIIGAVMTLTGAIWSVIAKK